jgi:hypothetical protein
MTPLFDRLSELRAWTDGKNIWNTEMEWSAYLADGHAWAADSDNWLGPVANGCLCDVFGRCLLWSQTAAGTFAPLRPLQPLRPLRPLRPLQPLRPLRPLTAMAPLEGWSTLTFETWLAQ